MKENQMCPSYEGGYCESAPERCATLCKDLKNCAWHNLTRFKREYKKIFGINAYNKKFGKGAKNE